MTNDWNSRRLEIERMLSSATPLLLEGYSAVPGADTRRAALLNTQQKTSHRDLVTEFDKKVEQFLTAAIQRAFPGEAIIGEEDSSTRADSVRERAEKLEAFWLIDPIDGTTNYSRAYPFFCSTAAFVTRQADGRFAAVAGATWDPTRQEMFSAARGGGAWMNRTRMQVTKVANPQEALLTTGFAGQRTSNDMRSFELFAKITKLTLGVRRDGAAALDLAYVACGRTDGYWESGLSPWDTAAGMLLITEAGGQVTHHDGSSADLLSGEVLSSNGFLHKWLQDTVRIQ